MDFKADKALFDIKVNETSKRFIKKIYPLVLVSFILACILSFLIIIVEVYGLVGRNYPLNDSFKEKFLFIYSVFNVIYSLASVVVNYFYFTFFRNLRISVINSDEDFYNRAFRYAYINAVIFTGSIVVTLIFVAINFTLRWS